MSHHKPHKSCQHDASRDTSRQIEEWNDTAQEVADATLPELFEAQVEKTPDAVAVVFEDQRLSYRELNQRANQLAHMLISRGVGPEEMVGICLERSLEMVVGLLGVLKAGAAYLPLDPDYPKERLAFMLQDAEPVCVVTTERTQRCLPDNPTRILLENLGTVEQQGKTHNPHNGDRTRPLFLHNPAYVIYTSGSTGRPKGVVVTHGGLMNYLLYSGASYHGGGYRGAPIHSSISFDLTITGFYVPLIHGDFIVLLKREPGGVELRAGYFREQV